MKSGLGQRLPTLHLGPILFFLVLIWALETGECQSPLSQGEGKANRKSTNTHTNKLTSENNNLYEEDTVCACVCVCDVLLLAVCEIDH